jgi:hypothetical protein
MHSMKNEELDKSDVDQQQAQQPPMLNFQLSVDEVNLIFRALGELPHRVSDPVIRNVMQQAQAQIEKPN